jgi:hypothetical protein
VDTFVTLKVVNHQQVAVTFPTDRTATATATATQAYTVEPDNG